MSRAHPRDNRPYPEHERLMVKAVFVLASGEVQSWEFNWNDRQAVRRFATDSDRVVREGGCSSVEAVRVEPHHR